MPPTAFRLVKRSKVETHVCVVFTETGTKRQIETHTQDTRARANTQRERDTHKHIAGVDRIAS